MTVGEGFIIALLNIVLALLIGGWGGFVLMLAAALITALTVYDAVSDKGKLKK